MSSDKLGASMWSFHKRIEQLVGFDFNPSILENALLEIAITHTDDDHVQDQWLRDLRSIDPKAFRDWLETVRFDIPYLAADGSDRKAFLPPSAPPSKPETATLWIVTRHRNPETLVASELPSKIDFAESDQEAFERLLVLAGVDEVEIKNEGFTFEEVGDPLTLCTRLEAYDGDRYEAEASTIDLGRIPRHLRV